MSIEKEIVALRKAGAKVLAGLDARIKAASEKGEPVPVFDGIAELHGALNLGGKNDHLSTKRPVAGR